MVTYTVDGRVLEFVISGPYSSREWDDALTAARLDPDVPDRALLLVDARRSEAKMSALLMAERVKNLAEKLDRKMGSYCALILSPLMKDIVLGALNFQTFAERDIGLRVAFFTNVEEAKRWLAVY